MDSSIVCQQMNKVFARALPICLMLLLAGCGGGDPPSGGGVAQAPTPAAPTPAAPTPTPAAPAPAPPATGQCSLASRLAWADRQIREWYLFPGDLPASLDPAGFASVNTFISALTATARAAGRDRGFTFITSIADENAFIRQGQTAAFGIRIEYDLAARRAFVIDVMERGPAASVGMDRGTELLAIGPTDASLRSIADLMAQGGPAAVADALGPPLPGVTRVIRFRTRDGAITMFTLSRAVFDIQPVPLVGGRGTIVTGGRRLGYVALRTFIATAEVPLRSAFAEFRTLGVRDVVIDLRYNSGGLVRIASLMGDLMGGQRQASDVFSLTRFRPSKAAENETRLFRADPDAIAPASLAFITTGISASASELLVNAMLPWHPGAVTLVGANTAGKPVGQIAIDRPECDDRLRIVAFATDNARGQGDYFAGLAPVMAARGGRTCAAPDDITRSTIDPAEASTAAALAALRGAACTPIGAVSARTLDGSPPPQLQPLLSSQPSAAQAHMPGLF